MGCSRENGMRELSRGLAPWAVEASTAVEGRGMAVGTRKAQVRAAGYDGWGSPLVGVGSTFASYIIILVW